MLIATQCWADDSPDTGGRGRHYHCSSCGRVTSMIGHFVGGDRDDARMICDNQERAAYLRKITGTGKK